MRKVDFRQTGHIHAVFREVFTGGSKGIGKEIALALVHQGCSVSIIARNAADLDLAVSEINALAKSVGSQATAHAYLLDVVDAFEAVCYQFLSFFQFFLHSMSFFRVFRDRIIYRSFQIENVVKKAEDEVGPIDILINNAGRSVQNAFDILPLHEFEAQLKINYLSAVSFIILLKIKFSCFIFDSSYGFRCM